MKKVYSQPQTIDVKLASNTLMHQLVAGSDAKEGAWGTQARGPKFF